MRSRILSARAGFTLMEMLVVAIILTLLGSFLLRSPGEAPSNSLQDAAHWFAHSINAAREEAIRDGREARIRVETSGGEDNQGRFVGFTTAAGSGSGVPPEGSWIDLTENVVWGHAPAEVGPMGDSIQTAVPGTEYLCYSTGDCDLKTNSPVITFYLRDKLAAASVRAVTLSASGETRVWRYNPETQGWE